MMIGLMPMRAEAKNLGSSATLSVSNNGTFSGISVGDYIAGPFTFYVNTSAGAAPTWVSFSALRQDDTYGLVGWWAFRVYVENTGQTGATSKAVDNGELSWLGAQCRLECTEISTPKWSEYNRADPANPKSCWKVQINWKARNDHSLTSCKAKSPTCEEDGYEAYYKCSYCGKLFSDAAGTQQIEAPKPIGKLGHDWGDPALHWSLKNGAVSAYASRNCSRECLDEAGAEVSQPNAGNDYLASASGKFEDGTPFPGKKQYYCLSFNGNAGDVTGVPNAILQDGKTFTLGTPTRYCYDFMGWAEDANHDPDDTTGLYKGSFTLSGKTSTTLYAIWKQNANAGTYILNFDAGAGKLTADHQLQSSGLTMEDSHTFPIPAAKPTPVPGYTFEYWKGSDGSNYNPGENITIRRPTRSATLTAEYSRDEYTVTYTDGEPKVNIFGDQSEYPLYYGDEMPAFSATNRLKRNGYVFAGWTTDGTNLILPENLPATVTGNVTYTAVWKLDTNGNGQADEDEEKYTVTYTDGVEGTTVFQDKKFEGLLSGTDTPAFGGSLKRTGYVFAGWTTDNGTTLIGNAEMPKVAGNATYTAVWYLDPDNDGEANWYNVTVTPGGNMTLATGSASQRLSGPIAAIVYKANANCFFPEDYAVPSVNGITVTRDSENQITISGTPTADTTIVLPAATARHIHSFTYSLNGEDTILAACSGTVGDCPLADKQATVQILPPAETVYTGSKREASVTDNVLGVTNADITYSADPINVGSYTAGITLGDVTARVNFDIVAKVTLDPGEGTLPEGASETMTTDATGKLPGTLPEPTCGTKIFTGWYTEPTGGEQVTGDTVFSTNATIHARFVDHPHRWNYVTDGSDTIKALCTVEGCDEVGGSLTIRKPALTTYGGTESADATLSAATLIGQTGLPAIRYQTVTVNEGGETVFGEATQTAPMDAGSYRAGITVSNGEGKDPAEAYVDYTIAPRAWDTEFYVDGVKVSYSYTGSPIRPEVEVHWGTTTLAAGLDYTVAYGENTEIDEVNEDGEIEAKGGLVTITLMGNYTGEKNLDFSITPRELTVSIQGTQKVYDGTADAVGASLVLSGVLDGDKVSATAEAIAYNDAGVARASTITATGIALTGADRSNYTLKADTASASGTITPRPVTLTAKPQTIPFGQALNQTPEWVTVSENGLVDGHSVTSVTLTTSGTDATDNGTVTPSAAVIQGDGADVTGNYDLSYAPGKLVIGKAASTVSEKPTAGAITYGETLADSTLSGGSANVPGQFRFQNEGTVPQVADSGKTEYDVAFIPDSANFATTTVRVTLTVNPKPVTVVVTPNGGTYGGTIIPAAAEVQGYVGQTAPDVTLTYTGKANDGSDYNSTEAPQKAGTYTVTATIRDDNYTLPVTTDSFTVAKAGQAAPDVTGANETVAGKGDGRITGVSAAMEYRAEGETGYKTVTDEEIKNLSVGTYYVRFREDANHNPSPDREVTIARGGQLTLTLPQPQTGYTLQTTESAVDWNGSTQLTFRLRPGYSKLEGFAVKANGETVNLDDEGRGTISGIQETMLLTVEGVADITAPEASIGIRSESWKEFFNKATFGLFFRDNVTVDVEASDAGSGVARAEYLISDSGFSAADAVSGSWTELKLTEGKGSFAITEASRNFVYVRVTNNAGLITVVSADGGVVVYKDSTQNTAAIAYTKATTGDQIATVNLNGNTIRAAYLGSDLIDGKNYSVSGNAITFKASWLDTLTEGQYTLHITYNPQGETYQPGESNDEPASTSLTLTVGKSAGSVSITRDLSKVYDGSAVTLTAEDYSTNNAGGTVMVEYKALGAEDSTYGETAPKNAGSYTVRMTVAATDSYTEASDTKNFTISPREVTITGAAVNASRPYDGTTAAAVSNAGTLSENFDGENLAIAPGTAAYSDKNVGTGKAVTFSGFALTGTAKDNYILTAQPASVTADITAIAATVNVQVSDKAYDGRNTAAILGTPTLSGILSGDEVTLVNGTPVFTDVNVGSGIAITFNPGFAITGTDAGNYTLTQPTGVTANITNTWAPKQGIEYSVNSNDWQNTDFVVTAQEGFQISTGNRDTDTWGTTLAGTEEGKNSITFYVRDTRTGAISKAVTETYKLDKTNPTGTVSFTRRDSWQEFVNTITFDLFYKEKVTVRAVAEDTLSGVAEIRYYAAKDILDLDGVKALPETSWKDMPAKGVGVALEDTKQFVYYVRITDNAGNVTYLSTNGAEYDTTAPTIRGVKNFGVYYITKSVTAEDRNLLEVQLNGAAFTGSIPGNPETVTDYTLTAKDKAGNVTTVKITMKPIETLDDHLPTVNTVNLGDKTAIEQIRSYALELKKQTAVESEKKALDAVVANCDDLLAEIRKAETIIALIQALPEAAKVKPDDKKTIDAYDAALAAYSDKDLNENVRTMVNTTPHNAKKLEAVGEALTKYKIVKISATKWTKGSGKTLTVTANGYYAGLDTYTKGAYGKFTKVTVDGVTLEMGKHYTAAGGSTVITLKASYLQTLSTGKHTIQVHYVDGSTNETTFQVVSSSGNPATGDGILPAFGTMLVSAAMLAVLLPGRKRKEET